MSAMQGKGNRWLSLLAGKLGKDVGEPGAGNLDSEHRPGRLPDGVARACADQDPTSRAGQAEQGGLLKSRWTRLAKSVKHSTSAIFHPNN